MRTISKLLIYGDSMSTGTHGHGAYLKHLQESLGAETLVDRAIGSSGTSTATPDNLISLLRNDPGSPETHNSDVVLVWHGSNDWYWGSPIGTLRDRSDNTFCGAVLNSVAMIRKNNPDCLLVWAGPIFRFEKPDRGTTAGNAFETPNAVGCTMDDYIQALRQLSVHACFPLIEMGTLTGINEENFIRLTEDRVHPNEAGYVRIGAVLSEEIARLWRYHTGE